jgi:hypothetical protein
MLKKMNIIFIAIASISALPATKGNPGALLNETIDVSEEIQDIR